MAYQQVAQDSALAAKVAASGGVYFAGGDQGRITQALNLPDGTQSALLKAVWQVYQKGGVIAGSSAGAAIMSSTMFYDAQAVLPTLHNGVTDGKEIAPGLGFIGDEVFIDQHAIIRGRFARMLPVMLKKNYKLGLGIDENTAMWVKGRREVEIIGYKGAILLDLSGASVDAKQSAFNLSNAKISYLDTGDKFDLVKKQLTPAADKEALDISKPYFSTPRFFPDILGNTAVVDLLQDLIDNKQEKVLGLAFAEPRLGTTLEQAGFEFSFSRTPESRGYFSAALGGENYTVWNVRLDVRPILLKPSLYRYR
ncbi:MAG: cyanophycinase [Burkholderiales bacterium]|nr:cyanophycinase [Burkholderiales bacterium]